MSNRLNSQPTAKSWSARIADRYRCVLCSTLVDWFDREVWRAEGCGEYREPIDPDTLLGDAPECVWPGLMSCDLIPLISNTAGDWLCLRVNRENQASEIVQWYHGGGDWIPWGRSLAEAVVFDALIDRLPGASRRHAIPAENPRAILDVPEVAGDPILQWALEHVPPAVVRLFDSAVDESEVAVTLLNAGVSEVAVRCELVLADLMQVSRVAVETLHQEGFETGRLQGAEWRFDVDRMPEDARRLLQKQGISLSDAQNWDAAANHCRRVVELSPELAWAWDILGYAAERRGDEAAALRNYRRGIQCSVFTDQSIRIETHWTSDQAAKFAAARLAHVAPAERQDSRYVKLLCSPETHLRRPRLMSYWLELAAESADKGDFEQAHRCYFAAGWDLGAEPITAFADLLESVAESAEECGQRARAEVAITHRNCLRDRYDV